LASSACGFAALVKALNYFYGWKLEEWQLSILARLGSGSACRSIYNGFVEWQSGIKTDGMDSFGVHLPYYCNELCVGILILSKQEKNISSRDAMKQTVETSKCYHLWKERVNTDIANLKQIIIDFNFDCFGKIVEEHSIALHKLIASSTPSIDYSDEKTKQTILRIKKLRKNGKKIFFTQDAGPNLHLLFLQNEIEFVKNEFHDIIFEKPFQAYTTKRVILVDNNDNQIGTMEKIQAHLECKLHRAFSIFIIKENKDDIEILMQRRNINKYHSALLWSNTCCGHPEPGKNIMAAAEQRLYEEIKLEVPLKKVGKFYYKQDLNNSMTEHEIDHIFVGKINHDNINDFNKEEICEIKWMSIDTLRNELSTNKDRYTCWLHRALDFLII
jgi:diphosphomevalonate decarboxylase